MVLNGWSLHAEALTQTASPITCANVDNGGQNWNRPTRAVSSNNSYANTNVGDFEVTDYLQCTNYGFTIPSGAIIDGITASVERAADSAGVRDAEVYLRKGAATVGTNGASSTDYPSSDTVEDHGGTTDLWGTTWTAAEINDSGFGVSFSAQKPGSAGGSRDIDVDHIAITVTYHIPTETVINTYYPGTASVAVGATSITLGAATGTSTQISAGDLVLIMQMQDAAITYSNDSSYGDGTAGDPGSGSTAIGNSGLFEYAVAQNSVALSGGTLQLSCGTLNAYTSAAASAAQGQRRFQVIRVPVYANHSLAAVSAFTWNGTTGGVLAFDVTGSLNLNSQTVNVNGKGFRGGAGRGSGTGSGAYTDYRTPASNGANGSKGEGIAGTPDYVFTAPSTRTTTGTSYPSGGFARGAPGNGGGGGTDRNPAANDQNSGGGGGGNGGSGGIGGIGWCGSFTNTAPYWGCGYSGLVSAVNPNGSTGGFGGAAVSGLGATRLTLGGGGGAATSNNSTGDLGALSSSGAAGGGIVMIRAGSMTGSATFNANGSDGDSTVGNDGSGGGGAGGVVLISAGSGMNGVTINVRGGTGGSNLLPSEGYSSDPHGPGGGGGGGYAITSGATASCTATGGASGVTYRQENSFGAYGAQAGSAGGCATTLTSDSIPGSGLGGIPACPAVLDHFGIDVGGGSASTCVPKAIAISARDASDNVLTNYTGTVGLSSSSGHGDWLSSDGVNVNPDPPFGTLTNGTANDGAATYAFASSDAGTVTLYLDNHHADDLTITVNDAGEGVSTTSAALSFRDNAFVITPVTCTGTTCEDPASGSTEVVAGRDHTFNITLVRRDPGNTVCATATAYAANDVPLKFWITRHTDDPAGSAPVVESESLPNAVPVSNNVATLDFVAGVSTFVLSTSDVGKYAINVLDDTSGFARDAVSARVISGASTTLTVRPFALGFTDIVSGAIANPGGTASAGNKFIAAGETFGVTVGGYLYVAGEDTDHDGVVDTGDVTDNGLTPSFGWVTSLGLSPSFTPVGAGAALGTLNGLPEPPAIAAEAYADGEGSNATLKYSEVGSILLTATAGNYLNSSVTVSGTSGVVGRFHPHHFTASGTVTPVCGAATAFTYMDQPLTLVTYDLTARNKDDGVTANYSESRGYGFLASSTLVAEDSDDGIALSGRLAGAPTTTPHWGATAGAYNYSNTNLRFSRGAAPDGPFDDLRLGVRVTDPDGANITAMDMRADSSGNCTTTDTCTAHTIGAATRMRYGRARLVNANGSELLDLRVPFLLQYYTASGFVLNSDDRCTSGVSLAKSDPDATDGLVVGEVCALDAPPNDSGISCGSTVAGRDFSSPPAVATPGDFNLWLKAPGAGNTGSVTLTATVPTWLQYDWDGDGSYNNNPAARASFGIYKGSARHIYLRELY